MPFNPLRVLTDMGRINATYLRSADFRARVLNEHGLSRIASTLGPIDRVEYAAAPAGSRVFAGLNDSSLALSGVKPAPGNPRHVTLVLPEFRSTAVFAGVKTALQTATTLGTLLGLPVRIVALARNQSREQTADAAAFLPDAERADIPVVLRDEVAGLATHPEDVWVATHWTTAHALDVAAHSGLVAPGRVVYLIQDYEPGFAPWSTSFTTARTTYHAGFHALVNSRPLLDYLSSQEGIREEDVSLFGPALDYGLLERIAAERRPSDRTTLLFYGRPSKPRNLFHLGVAALRQATRELDDAAGLDVVSVGENHSSIELGGGAQLRSVGRMSWDDYFAFLTTTSVVLSLQMSPHPSHPPLESAISGAHVVTNDFFGTRSGIHPRLVAVPETPDALGAAVSAAIMRARSEGTGSFERIDEARLGGPLATALDAIAAEIGR
jgi:hypothetical protein